MLKWQLSASTRGSFLTNDVSGPEMSAVNRHFIGLITTQRTDLNLTLVGLEWVARIGSIASLALLVALFIGEGLHPSQVARREWVGLLFFPVGVIVGMIVAWWKEGLGAAITLSSVLAFCLIYGYLFRNHIGGWAFVTFASPGFLFLLHWLLLRTGEKRVVR
jgi:hypothetical protein